MTTGQLIHPWLQEFGRGLQLVQGITQATLTNEIPVFNARKIKWAQQVLSEWTAEITKQDPSIQFGDISINVNDLTRCLFGNFGDNPKVPWERRGDPKAKLKIDFTVPGQLAIRNYANEIGNTLSGQLKKSLALRLAETCPVSTEDGIQTLPQFSWDALYIVNDYWNTNPDYKPRDFAASTSVVRETTKVLKDFPVSVGVVIEEDWQHLLLEVVWTEVVSDRSRREIEYALAKHFKTLKSFPKPPTQAHFVVW